jgi:pyrroloquinoline quinone (PQQ) biosynthesis protein C
MSAVVDKRDATEFAREMEQIRATHSVVTTRFAQDLRDGKAPLAAVKGLAVQTYYMTVRTGAPCIGKPYGFRGASSEILRTAIANAVGEIGYSGDPPHAFLARNMCYGLGMSDAEIEATPITPEMYGYIEMMSLNNRTNVPRLRGAIEITEADSAYSSQLVADACRKHYGLDDDGVRYWLVHGYADLEHGEENARIAHALCATRDDEDRVLAAATRAIKTRRLVWESFATFYA